MKLLITTLLCMLMVSACNTVNGVGRDLESLGNGISNTAEKTSEEIQR